MSAQRPSLHTSITEEIFVMFEVNGAAIEASLWLRETPIWAVFRAPQSLAPSPQKPTRILSFAKRDWI